MSETTVIQEGGRVVVRPEGDVVASSVSALRSAMRDLVAKGARELVVDLAGVEMVDSCGIGLLISAHNSMRKAGGGLTVIHASKEILDLFRTMRIHQRLNVSGD
jgi:anti-anti-sigma factor